MTYPEILRTIRAHRGTIYACINGHGGQFHLPVTKKAALNYFGILADKYADRGSDLEAKHRRDGALYIDAVDLNEEEEN